MQVAKSTLTLRLVPTMKTYPPEGNFSQYWTVKQACDALHCDQANMRKALREGNLLGEKWGDVWRVSRVDAQRWHKSKKNGRPRKAYKPTRQRVTKSK